MDQDPKQPHNLEDLDKRLYQRSLSGKKPIRFDSLHPRLLSVKKEWESKLPKKDEIVKAASHPSFFKKFFYFGLGFAGLALLFAIITFFTGGNTVSNNNIEINVLGNSFTAGGEELPLQVEIVNKNPTGLELADLFVEYDKGGDASSGAGHVRTLNSLGSIGAGKTLAKNIFVTLYGEEASVKNVDFTLQYRIHGSNAIFVKKQSFPVTISSAPVILSVSAPASVSPNQPLTFTIKTKSNSKNTLSSMLLRVEYPSGFKFEKASQNPSAFNNVWDLGDLAAGAEREITVTGTVYGQDGEDRAFHIYTGAVSATDKTKIGVTYNSMLHMVSLVKPFISARLAINGSTNDQVPVPSSGTVHVTINWANNLPTRVTDAQITVALSGNALNANSIIAQRGFYDSSKQSIVWNKTTDPDLATIEPSDSGVEDFSFSVNPLWSAGQSLVKPQVKFSVSIKGKQPDVGGNVSEVSNFEEKTAIVSSDLGFSANAFYTSGPFSNTGPIPPQANQPTTYTITWTATNSANALSDGLALATLPSYVDFVGTKSPQSEALEYDATTRTIRWKIGSIAAGAGIGGQGRSVSFQVRLTPSTSQINSTPKLVLDTTVTARDTFTSELLSVNKAPVSTRLDNDSGFPAGGEIVH